MARETTDRRLTLPWLLVATPQLTDPNFKRTVVMIVEHGPAGSMGFVINRPVQASLADLVTLPGVEIPTNIPAWYGGPVETGTGIILHCRPQGAPNPDAAAGVPPAGQELSPAPGIALSSSEATLVDLIDDSRRRAAMGAALRTPPPLAGPRYPYRFLIGYAGWGAGQLTEELHQGAWIQTPADPTLLFDTPWKSLWEAALGAVGVSPRTLAPSIHPYLN